MKYSFYRSLFVIALWVVLGVPGGYAWAGHTLDSIPASEKTLPSDPAVVKGKLANGFTYYIRKNQKPENRAVLYLGNKVGSVLETEDQLGLAHFTEHMAFKGTKNFPKDELIDYLQKAGVRFGSDLNAFTSFDETVYQLPIPSDDSLLLANGVQILRDWAQDVLMETADIETEKGVILEEKRQRKGLQQRIQEQTLPVLLNDARYVRRLPIGEESVFMHADPEVMRKFYHDWYRPDLQAIIAVGDFDVAYMEDLIKTKFSDLKMPDNAPERPLYKVELTGKNNYLRIVDGEITTTTIQIVHKYPTRSQQTGSSLLHSLSVSIFNNLMATRIGDLLKQANPPFAGGSAQIGSVFSGVGSATWTITTKPGETARGVKALAEEVKRVREFGFTQAEFDRAKTAFIEGQAHNRLERTNKESQQFANEYLQAFLKDLPYPSAEFYDTFYKDNLGQLTLENVNAHIKRFYTKENRDIIVLASPKEVNELPDEEQLMAWFGEVETHAVTAYEEADLEGGLMPELPGKGQVVLESHEALVGTTTWKLSNGVKVVLKPTDFSSDQIILSSFSPGGTSMYPDEDYQSALNAAAMVSRSGLGNFDAQSLPKLLTGKIVSVSPYLSDYFEGVNARTSKKDLETGLQLINLYFTAPRLDTALIGGILQQAEENVKKRYQQPANVFIDTVSNIMTGYHWRRSPLSVDKIEMINPERSFEIFKERFADASDFTFVLTGSFDVDSIKPLIEQYLGSLPASYRKEKAKDIGVKPPKGKIEKTVYAGKEEKATVQLYLTGTYKPSSENNIYFSALQEVLKYRMTERLRKKESGVYTPGVSISRSRVPTPTYTVNISFTCDPERVDALVQSTVDELRLLAARGASNEEISKVIAEYTRSLEVNVKQNSYWHQMIVGSLQLGEDPAGQLQLQSRINKLNSEKLKAVAKKYLKERTLKTFVWLPEKAE